MNYLSVCSGIEAATVGWHSLGWKPVAFSEIEKFPCSALAHHYHDVPNWGDMTKFKEWPNACVCRELGHAEKGESGTSSSMEVARRRNSNANQNGRKRIDERRSIGGLCGTVKGVCNECGGTIVDVLVGGTPCQSFSVAGLRKGLADPRGNLMLTYLAIAAKYSPEWLVWENVPGVLSSNGGRDFASLLRGMGQLGYGFAYRILDAQHFGVPQRRRRVFVVGCLGGWQRAAAVLFERHSLQRHTAPRREAGEKIAGTIASLFGTGGADYDTKELIGGIDYENNGHGPTGPTDPLLKGSPTGGGRPLPAIVQAHRQVAFGEYVNDDTASAMKMRDYKDATDLVTHSLRGEGFDASEDGTGRGTPLVPVAYSILGNAIGRQDHNGPNGHCISEEVAPTLDKTAVHGVATTFRAKASFDLGVGIDVSGTLEAINPTAVVAAFKGNQGSAAGSIGYSEHVAPTLSNNTPTLMQTMQVRRLTPRECERLQGFPDDYTLVPHNGKIAADGPRYKALGNSMAVPVMAWIGKRIQQVEEITCTTKRKYHSA